MRLLRSLLRDRGCRSLMRDPQQRGRVYVAGSHFFVSAPLCVGIGMYRRGIDELACFGRGVGTYKYSYIVCTHICFFGHHIHTTVRSTNENTAASTPPRACLNLPRTSSTKIICCKRCAPCFVELHTTCCVFDHRGKKRGKVG